MNFLCISKFVVANTIFNKNTFLQLLFWIGV